MTKEKSVTELKEEIRQLWRDLHGRQMSVRELHEAFALNVAPIIQRSLAAELARIDALRSAGGLKCGREGLIRLALLCVEQELDRLTNFDMEGRLAAQLGHEKYYALRQGEATNADAALPATQPRPLESPGRRR